MEPQQAEGMIALAFICVKCFVNFFVSRFPSIRLPAYCFFLCFSTDTGRAGDAFYPSHTVALLISSEPTGCE